MTSNRLEARLSIVSKMLCAVLLLLGSTTSFAWNKAGHYVIAAIAYDTLKAQDPASLQQATSILTSHPAYAEWKQEAQDYIDIDGNKVAFMLAAAFADEARRGQYKRFDRPDWHYVNYPVTAGKPLVNVALTPPMTGKLIDSLQENIAIYRDTRKPNVDRAIALSWILHLVGDLHQPLHVAALVNEDFLNGDRGGNSVLVRPTERAQKPMPLHSIWDGGIGGNVDVRRAANRATELRSEATIPAVKSSLIDWVAESHETAFTQAYLSGKLSYGSVQGDSSAPVLPNGYTKNMQTISREKAANAGQRIAEVLLK